MFLKGDTHKAFLLVFVLSIEKSLFSNKIEVLRSKKTQVLWARYIRCADEFNERKSVNEQSTSAGTLLPSCAEDYTEQGRDGGKIALLSRGHVHFMRVCAYQSNSITRVTLLLITHMPSSSVGHEATVSPHDHLLATSSTGSSLLK